MDDSRADIVGDFRQLPSSYWEALHACFAHPSHIMGITIASETSPDEGWPTFDESEIQSFQKHYSASMSEQRRIMLQSLECLNSEIEDAISKEEAKRGRDKVAQARALERSLEELGTDEHIRREAWRFHREGGLQTQT